MREHIKHHLKNIRKNYWAIIAIILAVILLIFVSYNYFFADIGSKRAGALIMNFAEKQGATATLVNVTKESGLYKITLEVQGQNIPIYLTADGQNIVPSIIPLRELLGEEETTTTVPKTDKPKIELYVMSFCPYGNEAENTMYPVYLLLKDKVDWNINYIVSVSGNTVSSLHGQKEVDENIREVCVKRNYGLDVFWEFITYVNKNCGSDGSCWEQAAANAGADKAKIADCFAKDGLSLMITEANLAESKSVSGSPTLIINGVKSNSIYSYGESDTYKTAICEAFKTSPAICSQKLSTVTGNAVASGGSC